MSFPDLPPSSSTPGSHGMAALLYFIGTVIVGLLGYFGVRFSQTAPLQAALNSAFSSLTGELQTERVHLIARISVLEAECQDLKLGILQRDGEIRGLKQSRDSLLALLKRSGVVIPDGEGH